MPESSSISRILFAIVAVSFTSLKSQSFLHQRLNTVNSPIEINTSPAGRKISLGLLRREFRKTKATPPPKKTKAATRYIGSVFPFRMVRNVYLIQSDHNILIRLKSLTKIPPPIQETGRCNVNDVPSPGVDFTVTLPPSARKLRSTRHRPSPAPLVIAPVSLCPR